MNKKQNSLMRFSRTERLAQLSEQEIVIERKKREIQAKLEAQKKKQTEETLRKLESSRETKKPGFSKKSPWSGTEHRENSSKEKLVEQGKESLTNAFSNDGSFLDHFKKLSQTGLSANNVDKQNQAMSKALEGDSKKMHGAPDDLGKEASEKGESGTDRYCRLLIENNQSSLIQQPPDSEVQFQIPTLGVVQLAPPHQNVSVLPSAADNPAPVVPSHAVTIPQFQGEMQNRVHTFNPRNLKLDTLQYTHPSKVQPVPPVQLPHSGPVFNLMKQGKELGYNQLSTTTIASVQPTLPIMPQNIPPPSPIQVHNIPPPPIPPNELPKLRSESISMTLKSNMVKKLEAIPNPLEVDQPPSPPSPKKNHLSLLGIRESSKETFFNTTPLVENVSSHDRESSRTFSNNDEDGEGDLLDEKYHHWAKLVARCGDSFEDCLRSRNQSDANIRFLLDKNSKKYLAFRKLVSVYRERLRSSEDKPIEKTGKLNYPPCYEKLEDEIISDNNEANYSRTKSSDEENCNLKECSERVTSVGQQERKIHSKYYENPEDCPSHNKASEPPSKEDCFIPSQKQLLSRETLGENSKEGGCEQMLEQLKTEERRKRKRKSRWGDAVPTTSTPGVLTNITLQPAGKLPIPKSTLLSQLTRSDPGLIQYARQTFGSTNLSEEDWKKAEDHYKINLLYQDMVKKRAEVEKLERQGKFKYEYDSDEDTEGGTWEHKLRQQEMQATQLWAEELTRQAAGKHHIGDFLPPEELERFMEKYNAVKEGREPDLSDYKEYKLKEDNVGYRLLQKMGWNEGQGLGQDGSGITNPVNKATTRHENQGLGVDRPDGLEPGDDEYDAYRKRMMLAYRFRPNPLNNPRRPYY